MTTTDQPDAIVGPPWLRWMQAEADRAEAQTTEKIQEAQR